MDSSPKHRTVSGQFHAPVTLPLSTKCITDCVVPRAGPDAAEKETISCPYRDSNYDLCSPIRILSELLWLFSDEGGDERCTQSFGLRA
jgi:hypothetical protein